VFKPIAPFAFGWLSLYAALTSTLFAFVVVALGKVM
jgi:hypothetical protein